MPTLSPQVTPYYGGGQVNTPVDSIQTSGAPSSANINHNLGTIAVDNSTGTIYGLASKSGGSATWAVLGGGTGAVATLTGNSGGAISPTAGNINLAGGTLANFVGSGSTVTLTPKTGAYPTSPYVVGPSGQAGYQTIQSAINAASSAGGGTVYIQAGTYTENLTLADGVDLWGAVGIADTATCKIVGVHTPPASGSVTLRNMWLQSATHIFSSNAAGTSAILLIDINTQCTNGYTFNLPNWTSSGSFTIFDGAAIGATNDGVVNNTGGATVFFTTATLGAGSANAMITSGPVEIYGCVVKCPVNFETGSSVLVDGATLFDNTVTFSNNSTGTFNNSSISSGSSAAITMSSSANWTVSSCTITSSNNPAIAGSGAGTLTLGDVTFGSNSSIAGTLTTSWLPTKTGSLTTTGNITLSAAGNKQIYSSVASNTTAGANSVGSVALVAGTATVNTTAVTANSLIRLTCQALGTVVAPSALCVSAKSAGVSFTILASQNTDTSTIFWEIVN